MADDLPAYLSVDRAGTSTRRSRRDPLTIILAPLVEMLTSLPGVGALMIQAQRNFQSGEVYALLIMVGLFGLVVNDLFLYRSHRLTRLAAAALNKDR